MLKKMQGFTLIELVIVIVILGILAVIAIPRYIDLTGSAQTAATQGIAGALAGASAINYSSRKAGAASTSVVSNCTGAGALLAGGALPSGYAITSLAISPDTTTTCTLTGPSSTSATFAATGVS